jgi:hypothetical protein
MNPAACEFTTTEAAHALQVPPETLRTQLKRAWLPVYDSRTEWSTWRRLSLDELFLIRVVHRLADCGLLLLKGTFEILSNRAEILRDNPAHIVVRCYECGFINSRLVQRTDGLAEILSGSVTSGCPHGSKLSHLIVANLHEEASRLGWRPLPGESSSVSLEETRVGMPLSRSP